MSAHIVSFEVMIIAKTKAFRLRMMNSELSFKPYEWHLLSTHLLTHGFTTFGTTDLLQDCELLTKIVSSVHIAEHRFTEHKTI